MEIRKPKYYDSFRCLASACPDSCCHGWSVDIDPVSAEHYRSLPGELGDLLRQYLRQEEDSTVLTLTPNGRCPMWQEDGLCHIQCQLGHEGLSQVCRDFPRLRHDYGDFEELGLELSCPEAARLILECDDPALLISREMGGEEPQYDLDAMQTLLRTRRDLLEFIQSEALPIRQTLAVTLLYGYAAQEELDGGEEAFLDPQACLLTAESIPSQPDPQALLDFLKGLEILTPAWKQRLENPDSPIWDEKLRRLLVYFIQRYFLQAVSDYDLVCRVKFCVASCVILAILGGDLANTAQLYSKEIENDIDNLESFLDGAYTSPALTDVNLLSLLLC